MSLNDQYEHGRIPLKPLPYKLKNLASTNEFIIDYGEDGNYHMYISDSDDPTKLIDLTARIIKEILPNAKINANQFQITLEGVTDPTSLQDIINFIYKRFTYPDNINGFDYERDIEKVFDPTTVSVLLRNTDGTILLPVTTADNVFDRSGKSIQDRLDDMTRLGFSMEYLMTTEQNQTEYEFEYPFPNYSDFIEVRIGTVFVDKTRYYITNDVDADGNYTKAKLTFINSGITREAIEKGRRIDILFIYNALAKSDGKYEYMYGGNIANSSISAAKLEKTSDSYLLNDPSSIATSAAVYNLFNNVVSSISDNIDDAAWAIDTGTSDTEINASVYKQVSSNNRPFLLNVAISASKKPTAKLFITELIHGSIAMYPYAIKYPDGSSPSKSIPANKTIRLLLIPNEEIAYILSTDLNGIKTSRFVHTCIDQETLISYNGLEYTTGDIINVYRNGVRLFVDIDYSINTTAETITLFVRTEEGERIIFETLGNY